MNKKYISIWDIDGGKSARLYADKPYCHYKEEVYPLFCKILNGLGNNINVLDIGAGPGHLAFEFYKKYPRSKTKFTLIDAGQALLDIAARRILSLGFKVKCFRRNFNRFGWQKGLAKYDAIISNNAIFHVKPNDLAGFYKIVYNLLNKNGLFLNQQSFGYECSVFADALKKFPEILSPYELMSENDIRRFERSRIEDKRIKLSAKNNMGSVIRKLKSEGYELDTAEGGYAGASLPISKHIANLRKAGFITDCIWRKMNFAVLVAVKGSPY